MEETRVNVVDQKLENYFVPFHSADDFWKDITDDGEKCFWIHFCWFFIFLCWDLHNEWTSSFLVNNITIKTAELRDFNYLSVSVVWIPSKKNPLLDVHYKLMFHAECSAELVGQICVQVGTPCDMCVCGFVSRHRLQLSPWHDVFGYTTFTY